MNTIAILGGGASGMAAALAARERLDNRVLLLERQSRVGRKLLATGNGRCNLTNTRASRERYHGANTDFILPAMTRFDVPDTLAWFRSLGLLTREEPDGRVYPLSDAAGSVLDVLRLALEARGVEIVLSFEAASVRRTAGGFLVTPIDGASVACDRLIVACGGPAGGKLGGTTTGHALLRELGHRRTALRPSLVQLKTDNTWTRPLKGVRTQAALTLERGGETLAEAFGEVQFTEYGVTGPGVYDISRAASFAGEGTLLALRLLPELQLVDIIYYLNEKRTLFPSYKAEYIFSGALHNSISRTILRRADIAPETRLWSLSDAELARIGDIAAHYTLPLIGTLGFDSAQATAGGVETADFDPETLESRLVPGLYACGEVLDIDGDCGGFNLQWAWSSGRLAGLSAASTPEAEA